MPFQHDIAGGQGDLIVTSLQSPGFLPGVGGWQVRKDGSVEFNNGTFRGIISGGTLIISQGSGATFEQFEIDGSTGTTTWSKYQSPTVIIRQILADGTDLIYNDPGNGNPQGALLISLSAKVGTAIDGTNYGHGVFFWQPGTSAIGISAAGGQPVLDMSAPNRVHGTADAGLFTETINPGSANEQVLTVLGSGKESGNDDAALQLFSESADATIAAKAIIEFGGTIFATITKTGLVLPGGGTPPAVNGSASVYGTTAGSLQVVDGVDGQVYGTERRSLNLTVDSGTVGTSLGTIFTSTVAARTYRIHGVLYVKAGATQTLNMNVAVPLNAFGLVSVSLSRAAVLIATTEINLNTTTGIGTSLTSGQEYVLTFDGVMVPGSTGAFSLQVSASTGTLVIAAWSFIDIMPV